MPEYSLNIGGLNHRIKSDFSIKNIEKNIFKQFHVKDSISDIQFEYIGIENESLRLPTLTNNEKSIISNFLFPPYIGRGVLVIPPLVSHVEDLSDAIKKIKSPFDAPLFQSEMVRSRIFSLAPKADHVLLLIHLFSIVIFDFSKPLAQIYYLRDRSKMFNNDNLENGIRRLFTAFLPNFNRVMLHSSGIVRDGKAFLFFAPDEGGKTTVIKSATQGTFLSDDRNILHLAKNKILAFSTPWGSMHTAPAKAELGGVFLLIKSEKFKLTRIKASTMLQYLWNEHIHSWNFLPKLSRIKAFNILSSICQATPAFKMNFSRDFVDWDAIDLAIADSNQF
jgi:hypothetical protein